MTSANATFLPYAKHSISDLDITAVGRALASDAITRGPRVEEFEDAIARHCGVKYAVAFNSGSTALRASCFAAKITEGDRLVTTPNTFVATAVAGMSLGATPVFLDVDPNTGNMDLTHLDAHLSQRLSRNRNIIFPIHYAGIPLDVRALDAVLRDPHAIIIEDAAAALGSSYESGHPIGSCEYSHMTVFSFHPAKLITTGEGGLVTTNDAEMADRLRLYRNNGIERDPKYMLECPGPWYYEVQEMTGNFNFTDFQAALGLSQLSRLSAFVQKRHELIGWYRQYLAGVAHTTLLSGLNNPNTCAHMAVVCIDFDAARISRASLMQKLKECGVGTQVHYIPVYRHPFFTKLSGDLSEYFPGAELFYSQALSLPLYHDLTEADVQRVCRTLKNLIS